MKKAVIIMNKVLDWISLVFFAWIFLLVIFFADGMEYACKRVLNMNNKELLLIAFAILGIICLCIYLLNKFVKERLTNIKLVGQIRYNHVVNVLSAVLLLLQIFICYNIFFETGWDPGYYIIPAARTLLAEGNVNSMKTGYFNMFPNNLLLVNIYYVILKINDFFGILKNEYQLMIIVIVNCIINTLSCRMIYSVVSRKIGQNYAFWAFCFSVVLLGLSPWSVICYSDTFALFIPILSVYLLECSKIPCSLRYVMVIVLGYAGYCIKPQVSIVVIALAIVEILKKSKEDLKKRLSYGAKVLLISGIIIFFSNIMLQNVYTNEGFVLNSEKQFGASHFFMMGLNPDRMGIFSAEDGAISSSCAGKKERREKNLEVAKERLQSYGFTGYMKFLSKKMLTNYNDGTFAWSVEGEFYNDMREDVDTVFAPKLKNLYYDYGTDYQVFALTVQLAWVMIIVFIFIRTLFAVREKDNEDYLYRIMILSLVGLTIFELLFEARARYLYTYIPLYIIVAMYGIRDVIMVKYLFKI